MIDLIPTLPTDDATGECFCPRCGEPDPEISVEAFEMFDEAMCADCAETAFEENGQFGVGA